MAQVYDAVYNPKVVALFISLIQEWQADLDRADVYTGFHRSTPLNDFDNFEARALGCMMREAFPHADVRVSLNFEFREGDAAEFNLTVHYYSDSEY